MSFATVMVCLALDQPNNPRLELAGQLAEHIARSLVQRHSAAQVGSDQPGGRAYVSRECDGVWCP